MCSCWRVEPSARPIFTELSKTIQTLMTTEQVSRLEVPYEGKGSEWKRKEGEKRKRSTGSRWDGKIIKKGGKVQVSSNILSNMELLRHTEHWTAKQSLSLRWIIERAPSERARPGESERHATVYSWVMVPWRLLSPDRARAAPKPNIYNEDIIEDKMKQTFRIRSQRITENALFGPRVRVYLNKQVMLCFPDQYRPN